MPTKMIRTGAFAALIMVLCAAGCGSDSPVCGDGTTEEGGKCVPSTAAVSCGAGTVLDGGECVLPGVDGGQQPDTGASSQDTGAVSDTGSVEDTQALDAGPLDAGTFDAGPTDAGLSDGAADTGNAIDAVDEDDGTGPILTIADDADLGVDAAPAATPCVADCKDKECGNDGCGGDCGACFEASKLFCNAGKCTACQPACSGKNCGPNGCGGVCGTCLAGSTCALGQCKEAPSGASCLGFCGKAAPSGCSCIANCADQGTCCSDYTVACGCVANCIGKTCGADGCGGSCGSCVATELCNSGSCTADPCAADPCNGHGSCAKATGKCACLPAYQGAACDKCEQGYSSYPNCVPDKCVGKQKPCNGHGVCQPASGACMCSAGFAGDACEKCNAGSGTWPKCDKCATNGVCDDGNVCTMDSCKDGACTNKAATDGSKCDDGDKCTTGETCSAKTCKNGKKISCDDGELCTADSCDAKLGCVNKAAKDGAGCGVTGTCSKGACSCGKCIPLGSEKNPAKSCKEIIDQLPKSKSEAYWLQPTGVAKAFKVYCDMTVDGGGWTLVGKVRAVAHGADGGVLDGHDKTRWLDRKYIGSIADLSVQDALGVSYESVPFQDFMLQGIGNKTKVLAWRMPKLSPSLYSVFKTKAPQLAAKVLVGSFTTLDWANGCATGKGPDATGPNFYGFNIPTDKGNTNGSLFNGSDGGWCETLAGWGRHNSALDYSGGGLAVHCEGRAHQMARHVWGYGEACTKADWATKSNLDAFNAHSFWVR